MKPLDSFLNDFLQGGFKVLEVIPTFQKHTPIEHEYFTELQSAVVILEEPSDVTTEPMDKQKMIDSAIAFLESEGLLPS